MNGYLPRPLTFGGYILVLRTGFWLVSAPVLIAIIALILYTLRPHRT